MPKDNNKELTLFEMVWGSEIKILPTSSIERAPDSKYLLMILIKSNELCYAIGNAMNQDGRVCYQTSVSPDKLMRYTSNGQYSSMLKGEKGFGSHIGFEIANNIAIETMNHIAPILNYKLAEIYYDAYAETNRLFNENQRLLTQQNIFVTQQINALKAKTKFLQEVYEDISQTSKSDVFRQSTCTSLQRIRIELDGIFYNFISQINQGLILKNFNGVSGNHICARYALSYYIFALVLEYVAAGLIDNESMKFLKAKVEEAFDSFNQTTKNLERKLNSIQDDNYQSQQNIMPFYGWYYGSYGSASYFDIKRDREALFNLIEAPKQYLQNIVITHEEE
ncbi:hypothetical protein JT139_07530 [Helicobacter pylori]|nr:hypothetical protein [Helicobacter pylori]